MTRKVYVRPGKAASVIGIIVACLMLVFGIVFFWLVREDGSMIGQIFLVFWMLIVILIIAFNVYNLTARKSSASAAAEIDLDLPDNGHTVEERLRSLERLKKDRLITEEEYRQKRSEIMQQPW